MTKRDVEPLPAQVLGRASTGQGWNLELQLNAWQVAVAAPFCQHAPRLTC